MHLLKWGLWLKGALGYCLNSLTLEPALVLSVRIFVHFLGFYFFVFRFGSKTLLKMLLCIQDYQEIRATNQS